MKRVKSIVMILVTFMTCGFSCYNEFMIISQHTDWKLSPSRIPVSNNQGTTSLEVTIPPIRRFNRVDSVVFELITNNSAFLIGRSKMLITEDSKYQMTSSKSSFEFNLKMNADSQQVFIQTYLYKKGKSKRTHPIEIGMLININESKQNTPPGLSVSLRPKMDRFDTWPESILSEIRRNFIS